SIELFCTASTASLTELPNEFISNAVGTTRKRAPTMTMTVDASPLLPPIQRVTDCCVGDITTARTSAPTMTARKGTQTMMQIAGRPAIEPARIITSSKRVVMGASAWGGSFSIGLRSLLTRGGSSPVHPPSQSKREDDRQLDFSSPECWSSDTGPAEHAL